MSRQARAAWLLGAVLLAATAAPLGAQVVPAARPKPATPEAAKTAFRNALYEAQNYVPTRASKQLAAALEADPQFGLAQTFQATQAAGLAAAERVALIDQSFGAMGGSSPAEMLLALYMREDVAGRSPAALPILKLATELAPDDAELNYLYAYTLWTPMPVTEAIAAQQQFRDRFPNNAAVYNTLAYSYWRAGDPENALKAVQHYLQLAPDHPNAHDSYADLLILAGRNQEALPHVQRIMELEPSFNAGLRFGAIALAQGDLKQARAHFASVLDKAATPSAGFPARYWQAVADLYAKDTRAAGRQLDGIATIAKTANLPASVVTAQLRAAVVDAHLGDRAHVPTHLAAAEAAATTDAQRATCQGWTAVALSRLGRAEDAKAAAARMMALSPGSDDAVLEAILALDRKDYPAAKAVLARYSEADLLAKALRAELLLRTGQKAEGEALRKAVLASSVHLAGGQSVDFNAVVGRMRLLSM